MSQKPLLLLSPMVNITDFPFREMVRRYSQPDWVCSEMIASQAIVRQIAKSLLRTCQKGERTIVQLAGNDPLVLAEAARISQDQGALAIDLNMGCPVKKIAVNSYAGSALMKNEKQAAQLFKALRQAVSIPVSVKMRKGWNLENQNALEICRIAREEGLSHATIHGRTRCQMFRGQNDWHFIGSVAKSMQEQNFPIIGNGDILDEMTASRALEITGGSLHGLMIGRGIYGKPWLLGHIRHWLETGHILPPPSVSQQKKIVLEHMELLFSHYGAEKGLFLARKHIAWYTKGFPDACHFRNHLFSLEEVPFFMQAVQAFYEKNLESSCFLEKKSL